MRDDICGINGTSEKLMNVANPERLSLSLFA